VSDSASRSALDRFEIAATVLLALATVATAWSGYQATRWGGETTKAASANTAARVAASRASDLANAQTEIDVSTFEQWVDAYAANDTFLADFYYARFRGEFKPAVDAWIATMPLKNPDAPLTPFAMPEYVLAARQEAQRQDEIAEVKTAPVQLRARRRPLRHRALLRRNEHPHHQPPPAIVRPRHRLRRVHQYDGLDSYLPGNPKCLGVRPFARP
jgi:hypothetical protein